MDFRALLMGFFFALFWSSAFSSARIIVADAPPLFALAVRFLLSGVIAVGIAAAMGQSWRLTSSQWRATVLFGICQNALYLGLNFVAMQTVEASLAAIIASTMPLWVAFFGWSALRQKLPPVAVTGLMAGFTGAALILGSRMSLGVDLFGVALCGIGVLALTVATMALRSASSGGNFMMIVGLQMLIGAVPLAIVASFTETLQVSWSTPLVLAFTYTTIFPGLVGTFIWFHLVNRIGPTKAATFHFLNPFLGVAVAAVLLGESLGPLDLIGVLVITLGILMVQRSRLSDNHVKPLTG